MTTNINNSINEENINNSINEENTMTATAPTSINPCIDAINETGKALSLLNIDESLPLNQRIVQCAETFLLTKNTEKQASEYIISSLSVSTTEELMKKLDELQLWPKDWKMPRSVFNAIEKGTSAYTIQADGFVQYAKSKVLVLYSFILAFSRVYNTLEKRTAKAAKALQELLKEANVALSALKDATNINDIESRLEYVEKCIEVLPKEKQNDYILQSYFALDGKHAIYFPVTEKQKTITGLRFTGEALDYDVCFFDALLFSYIPTVYDEYINDDKPVIDIYETPECSSWLEKWCKATGERLQRERKELQEKAERIAKEKIAQEGIANALLLQKYAKALQDIETAMSKIAVDISKTRRQDCNEALNAIREALKEAKL